VSTLIAVKNGDEVVYGAHFLRQRHLCDYGKAKGSMSPPTRTCSQISPKNHGLFRKKPKNLQENLKKNIFLRKSITF